VYLVIEVRGRGVVCGESKEVPVAWEMWAIEESGIGRVMNSYAYIVHAKTVDCQESSVKVE